MTTRIAHVYLPEGAVWDVPVLDFPEAIAIGTMIYYPDLALDGGLLVRTTNGRETAEYRTRREATADDQPGIDAAPYAEAYPHDDRD